jgi:uncharacterized damage-inducible protein DinB
MIRICVLTLSVSTAAALLAQPAGAGSGGAASISKEARQAYTQIKNNLSKLAEKVPEDAYSYRPVESVRTIGELIGHVSDAQMRFCSSANGEVKQSAAGKLKAKAELVAAFKESFAECDKAFEALTDANAMDAIKGPRGERTRLSTLMSVIIHGNEEYGYMAVYLRMKGITPPSSEGR